MKHWKSTLHKSALALVVFLTTFQLSQAKASANVLIEVRQKEQLTVHIEHITHLTEVHLLNATEELMYSESVKKGQHSYDKTFDLSSLESGNYTLSVRTGNQEVRQPFSLKEHLVTLDHKKRFEVFLPQINITSESIDLNLLNRRLATVKVSILDSRGDLVFEDLVPNVLSVQKRYNLRHLNNGSYTLVVRTPERVFYQDFARRN